MVGIFRFFLTTKPNQTNQTNPGVVLNPVILFRFPGYLSAKNSSTSVKVTWTAYESSRAKELRIVETNGWMYNGPFKWPYK